MIAITNHANNGRVLRIRLDKTIRSGSKIEDRGCNIFCLWCHHDYIDHTSCFRDAIPNQLFVNCVARVIEAAKVDHVTVRISGDGEPTTVGFRSAKVRPFAGRKPTRSDIS